MRRRRLQQVERPARIEQAESIHRIEASADRIAKRALPAQFRACLRQNAHRHRGVLQQGDPERESEQIDLVCAKYSHPTRPTA